MTHGIPCSRHRLTWLLLCLLWVHADPGTDQPFMLMALHFQVSTLDLCTAQYLGTNMLLLCSPLSTNSNGRTAPSAAWATAALHLQTQGWPIQVVQVLPQGTDLQALLVANSHCKQAHSSSNSTSAQGNVETGRQLHVMSHAVDVKGRWDDLQKDLEVDAVLVRPDGHIAWQAVRRHTEGNSSSTTTCSSSRTSRCDAFESGAGGASSQQRAAAAHCEQVLHSVLQDALHLVQHASHNS